MTQPIAAAVSIKAEFRLHIYDEHGNLKRETDWIPNLITNLGLDRMPVGDIGSFLRIGTGTATPAFTDTALQAQVASTNTIQSTSAANAGTPNYEYTWTETYEFALGAVVGNMAEIGVGWTASTANTLGTRARILDGALNPTTITVTASEQLRVTYRWTFYPKITDTTGTVVISGVTYNYTARIYNAASTWGARFIQQVFSTSLSEYNAYSGTLGTITSSGPSGSVVVSFGTVSFAAYTNGNYYRDFTISSTSAQGNVAGGIQSVGLRGTNGASGQAWATQIQFSPVIPKDNTKTMSLTFRFSWARH